MFSTTWRRPTEVPFPQTWCSFEKKSQDGKTLKLKIQDITEEWHEEAAEFMTKYYLSEEQWNSTAGCDTDQEFHAVFNYYIREIIYPQKASTICLLDNDETNNDSTNCKRPKLVGCNLTGISEKGKEGDYASMVTSKSAEKLLTIFMEFKKHCPDAYDKYNVDKNMGSFGLCVHPDYRGCSIARELLAIRIPLCKAFGVKLSSTIFSGPVSQRVAERVGFLTDACVPYIQIEEGVGFKMREKFEVCKLMSLVIS